MNKDEMIKDIRAIIDDRCEAELGQVHAESKGGKVTKTVSTSLIAKDIYNANCRIIADDEIVIKKSEYEKLTKTYAAINSEAYYCGLSVGGDMIGERFFAKEEVEYWKSRCIEIGDVASKETAKEILQIIKDEYEYIECIGDLERIIAKKYGIELSDTTYSEDNDND